MTAVQRFGPLWSVPLIALLITSCSGAADGAVTVSSPSPAPLSSSEGFGTAAIVLADGDAQVPVRVLVADEPHLRQRGLMGRESLPADAGMLFVFEEPTDGGFWMKDTLIPLSIAFIDDVGRLLETLDMEPCEADPCTVYTPKVTYWYALEVNMGFFEQHGVTTDWTVSIDDAL